MKIIKYESQDHYCLVHKTKSFIYYLIFKDNKYYYYESYLKNFNKTKKISSKLLSQKIINTKIHYYDDFILSHKADNYLSNRINDYQMFAETFGNDGGVTFCVIDKNSNKINQFEGQRYSPTFIFSYILYRFNLNISLQFHSFGEIFIKDINLKDKKRLKKYAGIMFYKYQKMIFEDIKIKFDFFLYSLDERFLFKTFIYYDKIININVDRIISFFKLNDKQKKISYIYYAMSYFSSLFFIDYIKKNNITNSNVSINSCLFKIDVCKTFFNDSNNYFFSPLSNLKNGLIFFIDNKYNDKIELIKNKYNKNMKKKIKEMRF